MRLWSKNVDPLYSTSLMGARNSDFHSGSREEHSDLYRWHIKLIRLIYPNKKHGIHWLH